MGSQHLSVPVREKHPFLFSCRLIFRGPTRPAPGPTRATFSGHVTRKRAARAWVSVSWTGGELAACPGSLSCPRALTGGCTCFSVHCSFSLNAEVGGQVGKCLPPSSPGSPCFWKVQSRAARCHLPSSEIALDSVLPFSLGRETSGVFLAPGSLGRRWPKVGAPIVSLHTGFPF